jgi:DNA repair protein RadA/Sms
MWSEESQKQIKCAERITPAETIATSNRNKKTQNISKQNSAIEPEIVIIDSIQTLHTDYIESTEYITNWKQQPKDQIC